VNNGHGMYVETLLHADDHVELEAPGNELQEPAKVKLSLCFNWAQRHDTRH